MLLSEWRISDGCNKRVHEETIKDKGPLYMASVSNLVKKFELTGQNHPKFGRPFLQKERSESVLNALEATSSDLGWISTRKVEAATSIPQRSVF